MGPGPRAGLTQVFIQCSKLEMIEVGLLQGFLDEQFLQLEELQDDVNPNFVDEVVALYFKDSSRLIANIDTAL